MRSRARDVGFAFAAVVGLLVGVNLLVEWLETRDALETHRPDDFVQFVDEALFARDGTDIRTTSYAERRVRPAVFSAERTSAPRMVLLGGSFLMDKPGGIADWLREDLAVRHPKLGAVVVNLAAAGQDSYRNREIARETVGYEPDILVVATCNNEGVPAPSDVRAWLHRQGGYRLMTRFLAPAPEALERPLFTPQLARAEHVRTQFEVNLRSITAAAREHDVPVLLATLPANLRYDSLQPMQLDHLPDGPERRCLHDVGMRLDEGRPEQAIAAAAACRGFENVDEWLGLAELQMGAGDSGESALRARWGDCVFDGARLHYRGQHDAAIDALGQCDNVSEALRWIGLAHVAAEHPEQARSALEQSIELLPRNRCRPTFNDLVRQIAEEEDGVELLDLARWSEEVSANGLPGGELFVDTCHLRWHGHADVAEQTMRRLEELSWLPAPDADVGADRERLRQEWNLRPTPPAEPLP